MRNKEIFLLITVIIQKCYSEFIPMFHPFRPLFTPLVPPCSPTKHQTIPTSQQLPLEHFTNLEKLKEDNLKFLLPFLDMEIQCDRNLHVIQDQQKQQIYILHGHELYQLFIDRHEKRLSLMGVLEGRIRHAEPLEAEIINWQDNILLVVALEEHLEVYQLAEDLLMKRAEVVKDSSRAHEPALVFEAIQQLTLTGRFQKLFLFSPGKERIMIIVAENFTKLYGKLRIFEWFNSYFDPIKEMTVPALHVINVIGSQTKYLITGRVIKHQQRTILTVYEISPTSLELLVKQTLTVESRVVHLFSYLRRNMIVACSSKQHTCSSFRQMSDGHFAIYRQRASKDFAFDQLKSSTRFIAASRQNQIMVFTNHRLDCYGSFISDQMDVTNLIGYQNLNKEDYLLLVFKRPFKALVRIVELEMNVGEMLTGNHSESEELQVSNRHTHLFESTVAKLRSILLQRKTDMDIFYKVSQILRPKLKDIKVKERLRLHSGNVGIINIVKESLRSPLQIMQKIEYIRKNYFPQRSKRSEIKDLFNTSVNIMNRLKAKSIKVENLIFQGDVLEGFSLIRENLGDKILSIKPKVTTRSLNTSDLILPQNKRDMRQQTIPDLYFDLTPSIHVNDLKVEFINGVKWNEFYDSLYLKNRKRFIEGRLVFQSQVKVEQLTAGILNGLIVSNLFNLIYPQDIHSELFISRFFVHDLKAKTVNGLIFEEDIIFSGDVFIEAPVIINHLVIAGDILLANNTKIERLPIDFDQIEFNQFYTSKIIVNGSLIVNNLKRFNKQTKIMLDDQEFAENEIKEKYLLRERAQNFSFPVVFEDAKVTAPSLESVYLNDHPTEEHMLMGKLNTEKPLLAIFMDVHIKGNVICRDYKSKIVEINENIIRAGDKINITGLKVFEGPLEINNVEVLTLNQLPVQDLVFKTLLKKNEHMHFKDTKAFSNIKVKNSSLIAKELKASYLNNLPLEHLLNEDYYMEHLKVGHLVETSNLVFHKINGMPFEEFFTKLDVSGNRLVLHKDLIVEGNVQFAETLNLQHINEIPWNEYVENLVRINEDAVIEGEVSFQKDLTITKDFEVLEINGYDLEIILKNVLMKSQPQLITGSYQFDSFKVSHIDVLYINDVNVSDFVDLSKNVTEIEADVIVEDLNIVGNLQGNLENFDHFLKVKKKVEQLPFRPWKNLYVLNNASWPKNVKDNSQQELLKYLYKSAVLTNRAQIITGNVRMSKPSITHMHTLFKFPPNLDLDFIKQDAVLKNSTNKQRIKGEKVFLKSLNMNNLKVLSNLNTKFLNKIDLLRFNQSLYRLTSQDTLKGPLKFLRPFRVDNLHVNGLINGFETSWIYQLEPGIPLPPVKLHQLYVENDLHIEKINDMSWSYFLDNRVTLKGPALEHFGHLTFEHLVIEKQSLIQRINNINFDNLVFKHSPYLQTITGHKTLEKNLELAGPAHIMHINEKAIMELFRNCLFKDSNYEFEHLIIEQAEFENGLQVVRNLNYNLEQRSFEEYDDLFPPNYTKFLKFLKEFQENLNNSNKFIIYMDYDLTARPKWLDSQEELTANQTIYYKLSRIFCCVNQNVKISLLKPNNFYLKNLTSQSIIHNSNKISIKAENYCVPQNRRVKSKITLSGPKLLKVFGMKRFIETIYTFNVDGSPDHFVIIHALDLPAHRRHEVRIFKIFNQNNSVSDWQSLRKNIGDQLKYFKLSQLHILLTNSLIDHHPAVTIYHFINNSQLFKVQQVIDGDYDIMEMLEVPYERVKKQLILSCVKCRRIFIYEFVASQKAPSYEIFQIITLKSPIDKLVIFNLDKSYYMLVISKPNFNIYNIYKYSYIQGWLHVTFGYVSNLKMSLPITELWTHDNSLMFSQISDGIPLMLLCSLHDCYVVKAIV